jgi:hypothetical protein
VQPVDKLALDRWAMPKYAICWERFGFSLYDSMIASSALQCDCTVLYSEDMQHGQEIDGQLVVINPFLDNLRRSNKRLHCVLLKITMKYL